MDGQDPTQKQIEVLQKAESCVTCTPSMVNSCCRTTQGATSTNTCTQQCQDYGTNTRLFDGSNCFCFDTKPTCDQLESSTQACKKGQNKNCFTGIALDKQKDKKSACETSCKVFGKDKTLVCKDKCYCLAPAKEPLKKKIVEHMDTCTSSCPDEYKCGTDPCAQYNCSSNENNYYLNPPSLKVMSDAEKGNIPDITDDNIKYMRCQCDNSIRNDSADGTFDIEYAWKQAIEDAPNCNVPLYNKFKDLLPGSDDSLKNGIAQVMCKYSNMTDPRNAPPEPSIGSKRWFMNSLTSPAIYGAATFLIYSLYMIILICTFYPRNTPVGTNPFSYSVFNAFWLERSFNNPDLWTVGIFIVCGALIGGLSAKYEVIPTLIEKGFGTMWYGCWFWILVLMMVLPAANRFLTDKWATVIRIPITLCFLFFSAMIIALNLFIAYIAPSIAIIILLSYRFIASCVSAFSTSDLSFKDKGLKVLEIITGMTPADRWVIPFLPLLGMIAKVAHKANNTSPRPLYFTRQTLGTIIGCGDQNLFFS